MVILIIKHIHTIFRLLSLEELRSLMTWVYNKIKINKMKKLFELIFAFAFIFTFGFLVGQMSQDYFIKHTEIKLRVGGTYIQQSHLYRDINPYSRKLQDTVRIDGIKDGFVLYSKFKNDTVSFQSSTMLSYFQDDIVDSIKVK